MKLQPIDETTKQARWALLDKVIAMQESGECPTCNDVYPPATDRIFYEDDSTLCLLEAFPRNPGHTIVMVKAHYDDISQLNSEAMLKIYPVIHRTIDTLKTYLNAEKVYLCTMCDGKKNHLHYQLIPRYEGDTVRGSRLFTKDRLQMVDYAEDVDALKQFMANG